MDAMAVTHIEGEVGANPVIHPQVKNQAFVTIATCRASIGRALVLGHSLIKAGTERSLVCMLSKDNWGENSFEKEIQELKDIYQVVEVEPIKTYEEMYGKKVEDAGRPRFAALMSKLQCWKLKEYTKCVFLDCNTLVMQNIDDLFEWEELSAARDIDSEKCFDAGVFVFKPSQKTFDHLTIEAFHWEYILSGDKHIDLLNVVWSIPEFGYKTSFLPVKYNTQSKALFLPEKSPFKSTGDDIRVIHFARPYEPLNESYYLNSGLVSENSNPRYLDCVRRWWEIFKDNVSFARGYMEEADDKPADPMPDSNQP